VIKLSNRDSARHVSYEGLHVNCTRILLSTKYNRKKLMTATSTGATGYIGGSVLESVVKAFPSLQITALLRSTSDEFTSRYPQVRIIKGDFDAFELIEKAAHEADIVLRKIKCPCCQSISSNQTAVLNLRLPSCWDGKPKGQAFRMCCRRM
jgi:hypothetical protein